MNVNINGIAPTSGMQAGDTVDIALGSTVTIEASSLGPAEFRAERPEQAPQVAEYRFAADTSATVTFDGKSLTIENVTPTSEFAPESIIDLEAAGSRVVVTVHENFDDSAPQVRELAFKTDGSTDEGFADYVTLEAA